MMAREAVVKYLLDNSPATPSEIHDHLESLGFNRSTSMSILSKMTAKEQVIRVGDNYKSFCRLSPYYKPNFPDAGDKRMVRPKPINTIFQECRSSPIQEFDRLIRLGREAHEA